MEGVEILETNNRGRGLFATRTYEAGQLIFKEDAFSYIVMKAYAEHVCHYCLKPPTEPAKEGKGLCPLMKCGACKFARYCNRTCQKLAWPDHKQECPAIQRMSPVIPDDESRMVARILWRQQRKPDEELPMKVTDLCAHMDQRTEKELDELEDKAMAFGHYFTFEAMPDSDEEMKHLFSIIDCNAIGVTDRRGLQSIAVGLFPFAAMLNHHCLPNACAATNGKTLGVRAVRRIEVGEEICISYIDALENRQTRGAKLKDQYYFDCDCECCDEMHETEQLKVARLNDEIKDHSYDYIVRFSLDILKRIKHSKEKQSWERMSNQALGALLQQDCVLADTHVLKLAVLNQAVEVEAYLNRQKSSLKLAKRVYEAYQKLLPKVHASLGMYAMKVGILGWQLQKNQEALEVLGNSAYIISKTHGEDHPIWKEIFDLIKQAKIEQSMNKEVQRQIKIQKQKQGKGLPAA